MVDKAQILKGLLEGCILEIISREETYGYQIVEDMKKAGFSDINEGTVYPVLMRLEKKKLLTVESKKSPLGPRRKYFRLSSQGEEYLQEFKEIWVRMSSLVNSMVQGG